MKKKKLMGVIALSLGAYILFQCTKDRFLVSFMHRIFPQKTMWFNYSGIDSLDNKDQYRYFFFYKDDVSNIKDKDSTLFILNASIYSDRMLPDLKHKIYLSEHAFPFTSEKENKATFYRVNSVKQRDGKFFFKLTNDLDVIY